MSDAAFRRVPCRLSPPGVVCSLGDTNERIAEALFNGRRGLAVSDAFTPGRPLPLGRVATPLADTRAWPAEHVSRNNRLLALALERLGEQLDASLEAGLARHPRERIGVVIGTSTSGIGETEAALATAGRSAPLPDGRERNDQS